ncbi:MAG: pantoate--beta-alanine ligase [Opitutaceae bacterium]|nr:pantoate--beta-alanine ligase [Opitutaceae bacterium]
MQIVETVPEMKRLAATWRAEGRHVALVPTMGGLHIGQTALIRAAAAQAEIVVVATFLNPLQFAPNELMANYPQDSAADRQLCAEAGATVVFAPPVEEMYPAAYSTYVIEETLAKPLCGVSRPTHFRGVTTLTAKLLNIVQPRSVYFGQKTAPRAAVVRKMIRDLEFGAEVIVVPTVRDPDGLACGLNNRGFTPSLRQEALAIPRALTKAKEMAASGVRIPDRLIAEATHILGQQRRVRVIYIAIVNPTTMEPVREVVPGECLMVMSAWIDETRLIDCMLL